MQVQIRQVQIRQVQIRQGQIRLGYARLGMTIQTSMISKSIWMTRMSKAGLSYKKLKIAKSLYLNCSLFKRAGILDLTTG